MGFPIRKFPDQSLFAAPRNLSQRTTSFIASQRQGIRRIPFRHLIVTRNQKTDGFGSLSRVNLNPRSLPRQTSLNPSSDPKRPVLLQTHPGARGQAGLTTGMLSSDRLIRLPKTQACARARLASSASSPKPDALPLHNVMEQETAAACQAGHPSAWPLSRLLHRKSPDAAEPYGPRGVPAIFKLSYFIGTAAPARGCNRTSLVEPDGIEPTTSCLQSTRSPN
jgi:hypothetical protein